MRIAELLRGTAPLFEPEDGGAGGGAGDGGQAAGGGGAWQMPEGVPEAFRGASPDEVLGKFIKGYGELETRANGLRTQLAQLPKAPESPDKYTFTPSDKLKPYFGEDNKALSYVRQAAHKAGIPDSQFSSLLHSVYEPMIDAGLIPPPFNPQAEIESFSKGTGLDKAGAAAALTENLAFAKGLAGQLQGIPEAMKADVDAALLALTDTAAGNILIRALSGRLAEAGIRVGGQGNVQGGPMSRADLQRLGNDPRIDPRNRDHPDPAKRFDPELRERFDRGYQSLGG